jgi:hypothetical protein
MTIRPGQRSTELSAKATTELLCAGLGGQARLAHLMAAYEKARPRRGRLRPGILTADEVFRETAKEDGFSEEDITLFIEHVDSWSSP